jgi:dipeptidyl-peptidase-4
MLKGKHLTLVLVVGGFMADVAHSAPFGSLQGKRPIDAAMVARQPYPGTVVPSAIAFAPDGKSVTYLKSETASLSRVLWRAGVTAGSEPKVIARPPGAGDVEGRLSREEALRRERQRLTATGISQVVRAEDANVTIIPLSGDLYLQKADGPLERLTENASPELDPKPTRDGTRVAFVRDGDLFVLDVGTKQEMRLTQGAADGQTHGLAEFIAQEELDRFSGYWWSPDGSRIAYQETDERHIPLYTIAHQGGEEYSTETHRYPFAGAANAKVRLGVIAAEGGTTKWLDSLGRFDDDYLARVEWDGPKHLLVQRLSRDQKTLRLIRVDVDTDRATTLIEEHSQTWIDLHDDLRVIEGKGEILWSSERTGYRHLELHDREGKLLRVLTSGEWAVDPLSAHSGIRGVVGLDAKRREVWFMSGRDGPLESHLYRVSLDGGPVERLTSEPGTHRAVVAGDGEHFVVVSSGIDRPPVTTVRDRSGKLVATLDDASKDPRLQEASLAQPQLTQLKNRDGVTLYGAYYAPKTAVLGPKTPVILIVYGGPTVQTVTNSWTLTADLTAQFLTERGFAVWKMDNRGSSRRGHAFQAPLYNNLGSVEVRDQVDGIKFLAASQPEVDPSRVGVTGGSYGGYMTLRCLTEAPDVFHAGVANAPVTDWDGYDTAYTERYLGMPGLNAQGYEASSVLPRAGNLRGSLLIVHGMLDENVHFRHTARLTTALIHAGRPFELLPLPDERHSSRRLEDRRYVAERMAAFFEKALASKSH